MLLCHESPNDRPCTAIKIGMNGMPTQISLSTFDGFVCPEFQFVIGFELLAFITPARRQYASGYTSLKSKNMCVCRLFVQCGVPIWGGRQQDPNSL